MCQARCIKDVLHVKIGVQVIIQAVCTILGHVCNGCVASQCVKTGVQTVMQVCSIPSPVRKKIALCVQCCPQYWSHVTPRYLTKFHSWTTTAPPSRKTRTSPQVSMTTLVSLVGRSSCCSPCVCVRVCVCVCVCV